MRIYLRTLFLLAFTALGTWTFAQSDTHESEDHPQTEQHESVGHAEDDHETIGHDLAGGHHGEKPATWSVIPFVLLLLMIATGPLFYEHFWHKNYPIIAILLAVLVVCYYIFKLHNQHGPVHALAEYVQFIALLTGLYVASGGIMIIVDKNASPMTNIAILAIGAIIANVIGTTGASMLLIRPFIRLNKNRIKPYHIIFFIFIVSNVGGSLTPIGDPPLFLGFLKGVPFFWTMTNNLLPWAFAITVLLGMFYVLDKGNKADYSFGEDITVPSGKVAIKGTRNFAWLGVVVAAVFLDPNVFSWVPAIVYEGQKFSFIREIIMLLAAYLSYRLADKQAHVGNEFNFEPIREVAFIFVGIFGTMMPALELVSLYAESPEGAEMISANTLYWGTGILSGFLDNAPTYVNFLTAAMAAKGGDVNTLLEVQKFAAGGYADSAIYLKAISVAAVFFGAMTYIGNGPNFMVKSIAEQVGIKMPSFFGYMVRYSIPFLVPLFVIVWLIFFVLF